MKNVILISAIAFLSLALFSFSSTELIENGENVYEITVKYSNGDVTSLVGYDLAERIDKELNCDFVANAEFSDCPFGHPCEYYEDCMEFDDNECPCIGGGCSCMINNEYEFVCMPPPY